MGHHICLWKTVAIGEPARLGQGGARERHAHSALLGGVHETQR